MKRRHLHTINLGLLYPNEARKPQRFSWPYATSCFRLGNGADEYVGVFNKEPLRFARPNRLKLIREIMRRIQEVAITHDYFERQRMEKGKKFKSVEDAFFYLYDKESEHYKKLTTAEKQALKDVVFDLKKNIKVTRDRMIRFLSQYFEVEEEITLKPKEKTEKKTSRLVDNPTTSLYLLK